jgi:hypothetical protein
MITIRELINHIWYPTNIIILEDGVGDGNIKRLKEESLFYGEIFKTRSKEFLPLLDRKVRNFGVIDYWLVIEVYR